jgi:hypothetical protein
LIRGRLYWISQNQICKPTPHKTGADVNVEPANIDRNYLNVKLGHRRVRDVNCYEFGSKGPTNAAQKLQRAIAESRGQPPDKALAADSRKGSVADRSDDSGAEPRDSSARGGTGHGSSSAPGSGTKRKYRRHPKVNSTCTHCCCR